MSNYKYKYIHVLLFFICEILHNVNSSKLDGLKFGEYCENTCSTRYLHCQYNRCECAQDFVEKNGECVRATCVAEKDPCSENDECCPDKDVNIFMICENRYCTRCNSTTGECVDTPDAVFFMSATQIILSATMVMGILALCTIFWRLCLKKSPISGRRGHTNIRERLSAGRASLNSIQRRVLARMRDRPPQYTAQHNIPSPDSRLHSESLQTRPNTLTPPPYDGPPTYEDSQSGSNTPINEPPPPYDAALMNITTMGVINPVFSREVGDTNNNTDTDAAKEEPVRQAGVNFEMHI